MSRFGTRRKGRRLFSPTCMCRVVVVVTVARLVSGATEVLHSSAAQCKTDVKTKTLECKANDSNTEYRLDNFEWNNITKVIIHNATRLVLEDPSCSNSNKKMEVEVRYSGHVTTERGSGNCAQQLILYNCPNVVIDDGVNLVRMNSSKAQKIDLPRVSQFDLKDSWVNEVSVNVDKDKSTFVNSEIELVKKLVINGSFEFIAEDSTLAQVKGLEFHSRQESRAIFTNVTVGSVSKRGFLMHDGVLTLENSLIENVAYEGILVTGGAELIIENSILKFVVYDSILVSEDGRVSFKNVTVGQESGIFFSLSNTNTPVFPLALLEQFQPFPSLTKIVLSLFVGLSVGGVAGAAVMFYMVRWRGTSKGEMDGTELLTTELSNPTSKPVLKPLNKDHVLQPITLRQMRPLPDAPKDLTHDSDDYDLYIDVQPASSLQPPQSREAQRPPLSMPEVSSSTGESTLSTIGQAPTRPMPRLNTPITNEPKSTAIKDDRDVLPPPPPPSEEEQDLYDDLADLSGLMHTQSPPLPNKPTLPPLKRGRLPPIPIRK